MCCPMVRALPLTVVSMYMLRNSPFWMVPLDERRTRDRRKAPWTVLNQHASCHDHTTTHHLTQKNCVLLHPVIGQNRPKGARLWPWVTKVCPPGGACTEATVSFQLALVGGTMVFPCTRCRDRGCAILQSRVSYVLKTLLSETHQCDQWTLYSGEQKGNMSLGFRTANFVLASALKWRNYKAYLLTLANFRNVYELRPVLQFYECSVKFYEKLILFVEKF